VVTEASTVSTDDVDVGNLVDGVPCLVRVLRCDRPLEPPMRIALDDASDVVLARGEHAVERDGGSITVKVPDDRMSTRHAELVRRGAATFAISDRGSKNGTHVNGKPCETAELVDGDVIETGHTFFVYRARVPRGLPPEPSSHAASPAAGDLPLVTFVPGLARQFEIASRVARSMVPVIVLGETGTGKELVARALHRMSGRTGPFLGLNCGAIPATLLESELFGVKKGAFSGAVDDRPGLVRAADHGTLFLDEIGELPAPAQVALLRVLQEQEVLPIGGTRPIKVDVRIVVATHRHLERLVDSASFRADLFARLSGLTIRLPALRDRREDFGVIIASLLRRLLPDPQRVSLSRQAARLLMTSPFPHNVRELEKALGLAVAIADDGDGAPFAIELDHLPEDLRTLRARVTSDTANRSAVDDEARKSHLIALLAQHRGRIADVARSMGKARMQIHRWIQRYQIDLESFRKG
jgi:DNA-binding NtrC family response regulator